MTRFWPILFLFLLGLVTALPVHAQNSFADLADTSTPVQLDWRNPDFGFRFILPPNPGPASLLIRAKPGAQMPVDGSSFLLSINQQPAVPFSPISRTFSARFDIPAKTLRSGENRIEITFVAGAPRSCLSQNDGGWELDIFKSRLDLALGRPKPEFADLENWLSADIGYPKTIAIQQGPLTDSEFATFGALVVQALGLRMHDLPRIVLDDGPSDLIIAPNFGAEDTPPFSLKSGSSVPVLNFHGKDADQVLNTASWFAENQLPRQMNNGPLGSWTVNPLPVADPLRQLVENIDQSTWSPQQRRVEVRLPKQATARLLIDMERPNQADRSSNLQIFVDREQIATPSLWRRVNSLAVSLPASQSSARNLSLIPQLLPRTIKGNSQDTCYQADWIHRTRSTRVKLQLSGLESLSELDHLAWNGGVFGQDHGAQVQIVLPELSLKGTKTPMIQSWRALAHLAQISGQAFSQATYGGALRMDRDVLVFGVRSNLPHVLVRALPASFAKNAGRAPGDPYPVYQRPHLVERALASGTILPAFGIAASTRRPNGKVWLAFSAETADDFSTALQEFADGKALDHFSGTVVRWRGDNVAVNATQRYSGISKARNQIQLWQLFLLILVLTGVWSAFRMIQVKARI